MKRMNWPDLMEFLSNLFVVHQEGGAKPVPFGSVEDEQTSRLVDRQIEALIAAPDTFVSDPSLRPWILARLMMAERAANTLRRSGVKIEDEQLSNALRTLLIVYWHQNLKQIYALQHGTDSESLSE